MARERVSIVGGGPAGASVAFWLARAGRQVTVFEKSAHPSHRMDADFLAADALFWLGKMGLDVEALGARPLKHLRLVTPWRVQRLKLGVKAMALSRRALDVALLQRALAAGAMIERGQNIRLSDASQPLPEGRLVLATGCQLGRANEAFHLKSYFRLVPERREALAGHLELMVFAGGFATLQMIEREMSCLQITARTAYFPAAERGERQLLPSLVAHVPHLAERLEGAVALLDRPLFALAGEREATPASVLPASALPASVLPVGDCLSFLPAESSLPDKGCARGLGFALHGGRLAARSILLGEERYPRLLKRDTRVVRHTTTRLASFMLKAGEDTLFERELFLLLPLIAPLLRHLGLLSWRTMERAGP